jgi:hypothetical protein
MLTRLPAERISKARRWAAPPDVVAFLRTAALALLASPAAPFTDAAPGEPLDPAQKKVR